MKKRYFVMAFVLAAALLGGCAPSEPNEPNEPNKPSPTLPSTQGEVTELLRDRLFEKGISVSALNSHAVAYTWWKFDPTDNTDPVWSLGQYCDLANTRENYDSSKNDLSVGDPIFGTEGTGIEGKDGNSFTLSNRSGSKYIAVDPTTGKVTLNVDTSKEYIDQATGEQVPRANGEDWVHMILSQSAVVQLAETESVVMSLDFTLDTSELYDETGGASQFQWIFSVHDKIHSDYNNTEYFWFNVTLYDNRYETFPGTDMFDGGKADSTGKYIYAPTGEELFGESGGKVEVGKKYHVELNLKEYMRSAFEKAQERGAMTRSSWEDLSINGFNLGWEVTNVSKVGVTIENLSLKASYPPEE